MSTIRRIIPKGGVRNGYMVYPPISPSMDLWLERETRCDVLNYDNCTIIRFKDSWEAFRFTMQWVYELDVSAQAWVCLFENT